MLEVSTGIEQLAKQGIADSKNHDVTVWQGAGGTGLTIHCNDDPIDVAGTALQSHCHARQITEHVQTWFGVCMRPRDQALRFGLNLDCAWARDDAMDALKKTMGEPGNLTALLREAAKPPRGQPGPAATILARAVAARNTINVVRRNVV